MSSILPSYSSLPAPSVPARRVPLDGPAERQRVHPLLMALVVLVAGFVLFQLIGSLALVLLLMASGVPASELTTAIVRLGEDHATLALVGNMIGLTFGLGVPAYLVSRLHSSHPAGFLRLRSTGMPTILLALLGVAGLTPFIQWVMSINQTLPLPQFLEELQRSQEVLLENALGASSNLWLNLIMIALTPAVCEELFFRGYLQRQLERGLGAGWGIALSGILFGFFHFRLSEVVALSALGVFMAYVTWRSGSLLPAIVVHFVNNAVAVVIASREAGMDKDVASGAEQLSVPWYFIVLGLVVFVLALLALQRREPHPALTASTAPPTTQTVPEHER